MDALSKLNEHFLSCNICTETFKDPCTLGCYHTFCRSCLTTYTKTRRDAITAKSILCPNCCQMTKVPRPQEPVDQWCEQFKPSFLIQGLIDSFIHSSSEPIEDICFSCQHISRTTQANSICEDCDIKFCEVCAKIHVAAPNGNDHMISPLGAGSTPQLKKRKVMCKEHNYLVEFCCRDCQKVVCQKCCIVFHRKCHSVVTLDSMIPEMKQVLQQNYYHLELRRQQTGNTLKSRRSEVEEITQHKSSLQSEIRRVSQQAVDLIRRKKKKLMDELDTLTEKQTGELRGQIKSGEIDLQTYQQYTEFIKQVLQSDSPMDLYDMYTLCQSGEITAEMQKSNLQGERTKKVEFEKQLDVDQLDRTLQLGYFKVVENISNTKGTTKGPPPANTDPWPNLQCTPQLQSTASTGTWSSLQCTPQLQSTANTGTWSSLQCTPQLQSTVNTDTWSSHQCTPQLQSTVNTDTWSSHQCTPQLQSTVNTDTWSSLQCTPQLQSTASTDTWSNLQCTPQLQSTANTGTWSSLQCTPQLQYTASTDTWSNLQCTPQLQYIANTGTWSSLQCTPQLQFTVNTDTWSNLQCTPQLQSTVNTDTWSSHQCTPQLQSTVNTDTWSSLQCTPQLQTTVSTKSKDDTHTPDIADIEIMTIGGTEIPVVTDCKYSSIKFCYTEGGKSYFTSLQLDKPPHAITKISQDRVAVSYWSDNSLQLIKLTPDPVHTTTIKTKKDYKCLTALNDTTVAAGCDDPPSIDVLDLSGRVLQSVITSSTGQPLIQDPWYMCTTRQGHIVVVDLESDTYKLTGGCFTGVTTSDTGSVIVADYLGDKIVQLTERGEYVRDLLTGRDGIVRPQGIRVHGNKLYVAELERQNVKIFQNV